MYPLFCLRILEIPNPSGNSRSIRRPGAGVPMRVEGSKTTLWDCKAKIDEATEAIEYSLL